MRGRRVHETGEDAQKAALERVFWTLLYYQRQPGIPRIASPSTIQLDIYTKKRSLQLWHHDCEQKVSIYLYALLLLNHMHFSRNIPTKM